MAKNIIIFQNTPEDNNSIAGFKILDKNGTKQFLKAVTLLEEANQNFEVNDILIDYDKEKFEIIKIGSGDIKVLSKLFNIEDDEETFGVFPDAINDAYELGLLSDEEDDDYADEYE